MRYTVTFVSLGAIHVGKQDVVVVCPVQSLAGIINSESSGAIDLLVNDNHLPSAVHAYTSNVRGFTTVHPEHKPSGKYCSVQIGTYGGMMRKSKEG